MFASGSKTAGTLMPDPTPFPPMPTLPAPERRGGDEGTGDPTTGLRGVVEDLGVLLAILLGRDLIGPPAGRGPRAGLAPPRPGH